MAMDKPRPDQSRKRLIKRIIYTTLTIVVVAGITLALSRLEPAAPSVDASTLWIEAVKRGPMVIQVRGTGTLVPEEIRWIPSRTAGRVEKLVVRAGANVRPDSVILELSNPELEQNLRDAELQLKAAEAQYQNLKIQLESQLLTQRAGAASVQADYHQARLQADLDEQLSKEGLISNLTRELSRVRADELETRHELEQQRLEIASESIQAQLESQQASIAQLRSLHELRLKQVQDLKIRPGFAGVVQQIPVEEGQQVAAGTNLARVAVPGRLKAEVRIPEVQARDIQLGQRARIDTRSDVIPGFVSRIDPAALEGTVLVDVTLEGELPKSARPDLNIDGTVELERLDDVLYVGRPAYGQANSIIGLFKLIEQGRYAVRTPVRLGRGSVTTFEIVEGLQEGERVILSDTSQWDSVDKIALSD